jgi:pimeloyl-ACP methyl ester carboxylesterase
MKTTPHRPARRWRALLVLALGGGLAAASQAAPSADLKPCRLRGVEHEAQCGVVKRALDPSKPQGTQIDVHFAVLPALARNKLPDPVFFFAGGPGQSAIDLAGPVATMLGRFSNRRDIVLVDQRGTGRTASLMCPMDDPLLPLAQAIDLDRSRARFKDCVAELRKKPHGDLRHYHTPIAMADADAVRAALGAEQVNIVGGSYGTRAVLEYQRQFPQAVRRAVIDGVAPPDMVLPAAPSLDNQAALDAMLAACAADKTCAAREPNLTARWRELLASLPRPVTVAHPVTGQPQTFTLQREHVLSSVRAPLYAPVFAAALPAAIGEATRGRFDALIAMSQALGANRHMRMSEGMHFAVVCSEDFPRLAQATDAPGTDFGDYFAREYIARCAQVPRGEVPAAFYTMPPAPAATLVLSGGIDPVTPPRHGARAALALGAKARHVVVPNAGHGVMGIGCMRDVLFRFVDAKTDEEALKVDTACVEKIPRPPMFLMPVSAAQQESAK